MPRFAVHKQHMTTTGTRFTWEIDLQDLRKRFPNEFMGGDEQTEFISLLKKNFGFEIPEADRRYSRLNIHLQCATDTDPGIDLQIGGEFGGVESRLKSYPVSMTPNSGGEFINCTIGVEPGLENFYPKFAHLHNTKQDKVVFKGRVTYMK